MKQLRIRGYSSGVKSVYLGQRGATIERPHHIGDIGCFELRNALQSRTLVAHLVHRVERSKVEFVRQVSHRVVPFE